VQGRALRKPRQRPQTQRGTRRCSNTFRTWRCLRAAPRHTSSAPNHLIILALFLRPLPNVYLSLRCGNQKTTCSTAKDDVSRVYNCRKVHAVEAPPPDCPFFFNPLARSFARSPTLMRGRRLRNIYTRVACFLS
jgi:hypothetical protein